MLQIILLTLIFGIALFKLFSRPKNFPPGPPLWRNFSALLKTDFPSYASNQVDQYGPVLGMTIGLRKFVTIHDINIAREAFNKEALTGRVYR